MLLTESAIDQFENSKYKPLKLPTNSPFWDRVHLEDKLFKIYLKFMSRSNNRHERKRKSRSKQERGIVLKTWKANCHNFQCVPGFGQLFCKRPRQSIQLCSPPSLCHIFIYVCLQLFKSTKSIVSSVMPKQKQDLDQI